MKYTEFVKHVDWRQYRIWLVVILLALVAAAAAPGFFRFRNLMNILRQAAPLWVISAGITMVMVGRRVDLSVGATASLTAVVAAALMQGTDERIWLAVAAAMGLGAFIGWLNSLLVVRTRLEPFVTTLGLAIALTGLTRLLTGGMAYGALAPAFRRFLNGWWGSVPVVVFIFILVLICGVFLLHRSAFGRTLYLIGGNEEAARLSGVPVERSLSAAYILSGLFAAAAGLILLARYGVSGNLIGQGYEFDALAAVVLGGTTFEGGHGTLWGTLGGVLVLIMAFNLVNLFGLSYHWQLIVRGGIIIGAITLYAITQRRY